MNKKIIFSKVSILAPAALTLVVLLIVAVKLQTKNHDNNYIANHNSTTQKELFTSDRVPLSFEFPNIIPVTAAGKEWENGAYLDNTLVESIDFSENFLPNARSDTFGYITVKKIEIANLHDYLESNYTSPSISSFHIEEVKLPYENGYRVSFENDPKSGGSLSPLPDYIYYFYKNSLLYQIALTNPSYLNSDSEKIKDVFDNIILNSLKLE